MTNINEGGTMKVGIVTFELSKIGGVATHAWELYKTLKSLDVDVEQIWIKEHHDHMKSTSPNITATASMLKLGGTVLSLSKETLGQTLYYLDQFDTLFFTHACLHSETVPWLDVYKLGKKNIVCISDQYWDDFYPYFDEAVPYVTNFYATNAGVKRYLTEKKKLVPEPEVVVQPFHFPEYKGDIKKKENTLVWGSHWRPSKGVGDLCEVIPQLKCKVLMFGSGRGYSEWKDRIAKMDNVTYLGNQPPERVQEAYRDCRASIDLTGRSEMYYGHHNRTTIEPMFFKCLSICNTTMPEPNSHIPKNTVSTVHTDNLAKELNHIMSPQLNINPILNRAYKWAREWYAPENVLKQLH